jgi:hypothetical protein
MAKQWVHTAVVLTTQQILLLKLDPLAMQRRLVPGMVSVLTMVVVAALQGSAAMIALSSLTLLVTTWMQPIMLLLQQGLLRKLQLQRS